MLLFDALAHTYTRYSEQKRQKAACWLKASRCCHDFESFEHNAGAGMHRYDGDGPSGREDGTAPCTNSMIEKKQWALELSDVLGKFFALLPEPVGGISRQRIVNRKGGSAELFVLKYNSVDKSAPCYWYGTTAGAVHGIIQGGFTEHNGGNSQECTMAGVLATANPMEALSRYAISTKFAAAGSSETPYVRVVLLVQATGVCKWKRNAEHVFSAADLKVKEAHFLRGYDFQGREERCCNISAEDHLWLQGVMAFTRFSIGAIMQAHPWGPPTRAVDATAELEVTGTDDPSGAERPGGEVPSEASESEDGPTCTQSAAEL